MNTAAARITRAGFAALSVFGLLIGATTTATAAKPPPTPKVEICKYNVDTSAWELVLVKPSVATKLVTKGVAAYPGDPVPDTEGYVFDANCVPQPVAPVETIFAVAYSDMDTSDGAYYNAAVDVLIAKVIDGEGSAADGILAVGDKVITNRYPTSFIADAFGTFGLTTHVISRVDYAEGAAGVPSYPWETVSVWAEMTPYGSKVFRFFNGYHEFYQECYPTSAPYDSTWQDNWMSGFDDRLVVHTTSPSQPPADVEELSRSDSTDDAFLDVDFVYDPTKVVIG